jgi:hypothetical protein
MSKSGSSLLTDRRRTVVVAAVALLLLVVLVVVLSTRGGDDGAGSTADGTSGTSGSSGASGGTSQGSGGSSGSSGSDDAGDSSGSGTSGASPAPGGLNGAAAEAARPRAESVPLDETSQASSDVEVRVTKLEWVKGQSVVPGERGGSALRVTVTATNDGGSDVRLPASVMNLYYGADRTPAGTLLKPGAVQFPDEIPAGRSVKGVFVFEVPKQPTVPIVIEVDLAHSLKIVSFVGRPVDAT